MENNPNAVAVGRCQVPLALVVADIVHISAVHTLVTSLYRRGWSNGRQTQDTVRAIRVSPFICFGFLEDCATGGTIRDTSNSRTCVFGVISGNLSPLRPPESKHQISGIFLAHSKMREDERFSLSFDLEIARMRKGKAAPCTYPSLDDVAVRFSDRNSNWMKSPAGFVTSDTTWLLFL
jgi:hypothetical protein